jgi:uncharacterized damage-inducible protein DinB
MADLSSLLIHLAWADERTRASIESLDPQSEAYAECVRLYAHMAAAQHVWLARVLGATPRHAVWPALSLAEAAELSRESLAGWREVAAQGNEILASTVEYLTGTGARYHNTVDEIVTQVLLHGSHHRGQVAHIVRRAGGQPAATDWIFHRREP